LKLRLNTGTDVSTNGLGSTSSCTAPGAEADSNVVDDLLLLQGTAAPCDHCELELAHVECRQGHRVLLRWLVLVLGRRRRGGGGRDHYGHHHWVTTFLGYAAHHAWEASSSSGSVAWGSGLGGAERVERMAMRIWYALVYLHPLIRWPRSEALGKIQIHLSRSLALMRN
jgi:hypothetical protein